MVKQDKQDIDIDMVSKCNFGLTPELAVKPCEKGCIYSTSHLLPTPPRSKVFYLFCSFLRARQYLLKLHELYHIIICLEKKLSC